jgi:molybdate transport system regulatory protein
MKGGRTPTREGVAITIRLRFGEKAALGHGKVRLLELIGTHGSIAAAGRAMGMSYRRAWMLVDEVNAMFREPLVVKQTGGSHGGGATLTACGARVIEHYRNMEHALSVSAADEINALLALSAKDSEAH